MSAAAFDIDAAAPAPGVSFRAAERFAEHFGRTPAPEAWRAAVLAIIDGGAVLLRRFADGSEEYGLAIGEVALRAVWRPEDGVIVTVMPPDRAPVPRPRRAGWTRRPL